MCNFLKIHYWPYQGKNIFVVSAKCRSSFSGQISHINSRYFCLFVHTRVMFFLKNINCIDFFYILLAIYPLIREKYLCRLLLNVYRLSMVKYRTSYHFSLILSYCANSSHVFYSKIYKLLRFITIHCLDL